MTTLRRSLSLLLVLSGPVAAVAQSLPTTQPNILTITREEVKTGRAADHTKIEAGWPAAYEKAKSPYYYLAMTSMTGADEAWYVSTYDSHAAMADSMKHEDSDPVLSTEIARLARADADVVNRVTRIQARARKDLSYGAFPEIAKQRFFEISFFRVRPGHEQQFEAGAKAYAASAKRAGANSGFRVYEVIAGLPSPTYLIFSSVASYAEFDQSMVDGDKTLAGANAEEMGALQKVMLEGVINTETQRFRVEPAHSYVPKETRASDPAFWMPKKPAVPKPTAQ